jgi:TLD
VHNLILFYFYLYLHLSAYFGTGESFLFSLYPERARYQWVGIDSDKNVDHASELFMAADNKMLTIGGGLVELLK